MKVETIMSKLKRYLKFFKNQNNVKEDKIWHKSCKIRHIELNGKQGKTISENKIF